MTQFYTKKVMNLFKNPKNMGRIKNADAIGKVGNPVCGDVMKLYIKVKNKKIINIKFETFGCVSAIATSSMVTELAKGKTINYALKITKNDIIRKLGGLPQQKVHCSLLAIDALREAVYDYMKKMKMKIPSSLEKDHKNMTLREKHKH